MIIFHETTFSPELFLMPHITVFFNATLIPQDSITALKQALPRITALALNSNPLHRSNIRLPQAEEKEIAVTQQPWHETDVNTSPISIMILAGISNGRDPEAVTALIMEALKQEALLPTGNPPSNIWLHFSSNNSFLALS